MCRISGVATRVALYSIGDIGSTMSGPGIRYYHLAQELARTFEVTLLTPNEADVEVEGVQLVPVGSVAPRDLAGMLERFDAVVAQKLPDPVARRLARSDVRVIYDLYVPQISEHLAMVAVELQHPSSLRFYEQAMLSQRLALVTGDAFVCASERQRDFWLGMLSALGRVDLDAYRADATLRDLIDVVPFGLPAEPPVAGEPVLKGVLRGIDVDDKVLLWGGGVWNWFDPLTVIRAVEAVSAGRDDVKLVFLGLRHPQVPEMAMAARALELARSRGLLDRVVFANETWIPYADRQRYLLEADVGVSAHFDSIETRYAFRTRLLDYVWAALPTISTRGDVLSDLLAERGVGRALAPGDAAAWVTAVEELLAPGAQAEARSHAERVRGEFAWPRVVAPLTRLLTGGGASKPDRVRELQLRTEDLVLRLRTSYEIRGGAGFARTGAVKLARLAAAAFRR